MLPLTLLLIGCPPPTTGDDTADTGPGAANRNPQWCAPTLAYRVPLVASGPATTPIEAHVDFADALATAGDTSGLDATSLRAWAVADGTCVALPVQFLDGFSGILSRSPSSDALGDEAGAVVVLRDALAVRASDLHVFFDSTQSAGTDELHMPTELTATVTRVHTGVAEASFDPTRGGMLWELRLGTSPSLATIAGAWRGNGINTGTTDNEWTLSPQDAPGALELLADGPVVAGVRASGERSDSRGGYAYTHEYWLFAGRPEVYGKVHQVTTDDTYVQHPGDFTHGLRPWQVRHDHLDASGIVERQTGTNHAWVHDGTLGVAHGMVRAPTYPIDVLNDDAVPREVGFVANDYLPEGLGSPYQLPAGVTVFDHAVFVVLPFRTSERVRQPLLDAMHRPDVVVGAVEVGTDAGG